jgi:hypothetical protein
MQLSKHQYQVHANYQTTQIPFRTISTKSISLAQIALEIILCKIILWVIIPIVFPFASQQSTSLLEYGLTRSPCFRFRCPIRTFEKFSRQVLNPPKNGEILVMNPSPVTEFQLPDTAQEVVTTVILIFLWIEFSRASEIVS